jgi:2-polyprenyl-3-methyl-5-hydroxy-6-metoxy-1,4-benzoquinol methylase
MSLETELVKFLDGMIASCEGLRKNFAAPNTQVSAQVSPQVSVNEILDVSSFESLKQVLYSDRWPEAVNKNLICDPNSDKDKIERGRGILELMIDEDLKGLKVLDYGCGEGHCAYLSSEYDTITSVGYDVVEYPQWKNFEHKQNTTITTDWGFVKSNGPYNVIILFDVIDHLKIENPTEVLRKLGELLAPDGKIYMRCHPITSRHGTHLYHDLNKAYVHLVFTGEELRQLVPESKFQEKNIGSFYPVATYNQQIEEAGLKVLNKRDIRENPEDFFKTPAIAERIMKNTGHTAFPEFQMSLSFIDICLQK